MRIAYACHLCYIFIFLSNKTLLLYQLAFERWVFTVNVCFFFLLETVEEVGFRGVVDVESVILLTVLKPMKLHRNYSP